MYWIESIHTAGEVSLFCYMVGASRFKVPPTLSQEFLPWDGTKNCYSASTPNGPCGFDFLYWAADAQRSK
jgi:hypothetical protein